MRAWSSQLCLLLSFSINGLCLAVSLDGVADEQAIIGSLEVDRTMAYVNEQILLTLTVAAPEAAFNITRSDLQIADAKVVSLRKQQYTDTIADAPYQLTKTVFALFTNKTGVLKIPAVTMRAVLPVSAGSADLATPHSRTNPVIRASTEPLQISIQPAPSGHSTWLPAQDIKLSSHWARGTDTSSVSNTLSELTSAAGAFTAGEPITRRISVEVFGQHPAAVTELDHNTPEHMRIYPARPALETQISASGLNGIQTLMISYVASRPGAYQLPELALEWWDINRKKWRTSTLPAERLEIRPESLNVSVGSRLPEYYRIATAVLTLLCTALAVACLLLWHRLQSMTIAQSSNLIASASIDAELSEPAAWAAVKRELRGTDLKTTRKAIISWAACVWPDGQITRLDQIVRNVDPPIVESGLSLENLLHQFDEQLYGAENPGRSDAAKLLTLLKRLRKQLRVCRQKADLSELLYPSS